jgi:ABC-2 type transport system permease protein
MGSGRFAKVRAVAMREIRVTVFTKAFFFAVVGVPILTVLVGAGVLLVYASTTNDALVGTVGLVTGDADLLEAARIETGQGGMADVVEAARGRARRAMGETASKVAEAMIGRAELTVVQLDAIDDAVRKRVGAGELLAVVEVDPRLLDPERPADAEPPPIRILAGPALARDRFDRVGGQMARAVSRVRSTRGGVDVPRARALLERPAVVWDRLLESGAVISENPALRFLRRIVLPGMLLALMWGGAFVSAQRLLYSTVEEKADKVIEVLLSAIGPTELMAGKVLGQGVVGLIVVGVYGLMGIFGLLLLAHLELLTGWQVVTFGVFFVMAYFMIAAIMAAIGSAVADVQDATTLLAPVMALLGAGTAFWFPVSDAPNSMLAVGASFVPPVMPFVMVVRIAAAEPIPTWQVLTSIVWGFVCVAFMIRGAAKVFRVGVLMEGRSARPTEMLKWLWRA